MSSLNDISKRHHAWLTQMGWAHNTTALEQLALISSEVGEAAAECEGNPALRDQLAGIMESIAKAVNECRGATPTDKLPAELADIILRVLGLSEKLGIDMEEAIERKMEANAARGSKGRLK